MYTVWVDIDPSSLRQSLDSAYPNNVVEVHGSGDRLVVSGTVASAEVSDGVMKLASMYTKDVVNSLRVVPVHGKQVELKLRIAEADRTKLEQYGINIFHSVGNTIGSTSTGMYSSSIAVTPATPTTAATALATNPLSIFLYNFGHGTGVTIQDLEQKQVLADSSGADADDDERPARALPLRR